MPNAEKVTAVNEIAEKFSRAGAAVITEYRGLTVKQVTDLRRALGNDATLRDRQEHPDQAGSPECRRRTRREPARRTDSYRVRHR